MKNYYDYPEDNYREDVRDLERWRGIVDTRLNNIDRSLHRIDGSLHELHETLKQTKENIDSKIELSVVDINRRVRELESMEQQFRGSTKVLFFLAGLAFSFVAEIIYIFVKNYKVISS